MELNNTEVVGQKEFSKSKVHRIGKEPSAGPAQKLSLKAQIRAIDSLTELEVSRMYQLFSEYYEGHSRQQFQNDLIEKDDVILLRDSKDQSIQGFSTLLKVEISTSSKANTIGIFSGDTVAAKEYWGSPALGVAFLKYLWMEKAKRPLGSVYWFLMSKGYKTYLLMANNFHVHYPRLEEPTPTHYQKMIDQFYGNRFGTLYQSKEGLIEMQGPTCRLKEAVADLSPDLLLIPRVHFFNQRNPDWKNGTELCCIAEMTLLMPLKYGLKKFLKGLFK